MYTFLQINLIQFFIKTPKVTLVDTQKLTPIFLYFFSGLYILWRYLYIKNYPLVPCTIISYGKCPLKKFVLNIWPVCVFCCHHKVSNAFRSLLSLFRPMVVGGSTMICHWVSCLLGLVFYAWQMALMKST